MPASTLPAPLSETEIRELGQAAMGAKEGAYCPYSHFRVGCAILVGAEGKAVTGANVENAAYPVGMCAERCAGGRAVVEGYREWKAIAVATDISPPASPCGMCRQFIREFSPLSLPIYMYDKDGKYVLKTLEELLPMSFGPDDLKGNMGEGK